MWVAERAVCERFTADTIQRNKEFRDKKSFRRTDTHGRGRRAVNPQSQHVPTTTTTTTTTTTKV